jgi:hypothetical protein
MPAVPLCAGCRQVLKHELAEDHINLANTFSLIFLERSLAVKRKKPPKLNVLVVQAVSSSIEIPSQLCSMPLPGQLCVMLFRTRPEHIF